MTITKKSFARYAALFSVLLLAGGAFLACSHGGHSHASPSPEEQTSNDNVFHPDAYIYVQFDQTPEIADATKTARIYKSNGELVDTIRASGETYYTGTSTDAESGERINQINAADQLIWVDEDLDRLVIVPHTGKAGHSLFEAGTSYYVQIDNGLVNGTINNVSFGGISDTTSLTFTTKSGVDTSNNTLTVAPDGSGSFYTIQGAFNYLRSFGLKGKWTISVAPGIYHERLYYYGNADVTIAGPNAPYGDGVVVKWTNNDAINKGTRNRPVFLWQGHNLVLKNITVVNTTIRGQGGVEGEAQAETFYFDSKYNLVAYNSTFSSYQDTLLIGKQGARAWFYKCHILGDVDFLWGMADVALFEECNIVCVTDEHKASNWEAYITEPRTVVTGDIAYKGFVVYKSSITVENGCTAYFGRTIGNGTQAAFINNVIKNGTVDAKVWYQAPGVSGANLPVMDIANDNAIGFKDYGNKTESGAALDDSNRMENTYAISDYLANREYNGRAVILNRGYDQINQKYVTIDPWDISAYETEFNATADTSAGNVFVEPVALAMTGNSGTLKAYDFNGAEIPSASWESNATGVVTVSGGALTKVASGSATVTVRNGTHTDSAIVYAYNVTVSADTSAMTLDLNGAATETRTVTVGGEDATQIGSFKYKSSDVRVATVTDVGVVTPVKMGVATITMYNDKYPTVYEYTVTVKDTTDITADYTIDLNEVYASANGMYDFGKVAMTKGNRNNNGYTSNGGADTHGWYFAAEGTVTFGVTGASTISLTGCDYLTVGDVVATSTNGWTETVQSVKNCNGTYSFTYTESAATTLTFTFSATTYLPTIAVEKYVPPSFALDKSSLTLDLNGTNSGTITATLSSGSVQTVASSDDTVATASLSGTTVTVSAQEIGETTITVTASDGSKQTCTVHVNNSTVEESYSYDLTTLEASAGDYGRIALTGGKWNDASHGWNFSANDSISVKVPGASVVRITGDYYSAVGSITATGGTFAKSSLESTGVKNGGSQNHQNGGTTMNFIYTDSSAATLTFTFSAQTYVPKIAVSKYVPPKFEIDTTDMALDLSGTATLTRAAKINDSSVTVTYSSEKAGIATVDSAGKVTAVGLGTTKIKAVGSDNSELAYTVKVSKSTPDESEDFDFRGDTVVSGDYGILAVSSGSYHGDQYGIQFAPGTTVTIKVAGRSTVYIGIENYAANWTVSGKTSSGAALSSSAFSATTVNAISTSNKMNKASIAESISGGKMASFNYLGTDAATITLTATGSDSKYLAAIAVRKFTPGVPFDVTVDWSKIADTVEPAAAYSDNSYTAGNITVYAQNNGFQGKKFNYWAIANTTGVVDLSSLKSYIDISSAGMTGSGSYVKLTLSAHASTENTYATIVDVAKSTILSAQLLENSSTYKDYVWYIPNGTNIRIITTGADSNLTWYLESIKGEVSDSIPLSVSLDKTAYSVDKSTGTVTASAMASDGSTVTYSSSNENVFTVNSSTGVITGVNCGTATLTASSGSATATATVKVTQSAAVAEDTSFNFANGDLFTSYMNTLDYGIIKINPGNSNAYGYNSNDVRHGAVFKSGNSIEIKVASRCTLKLGGCQYSENANCVTVTTTSGTVTTLVTTAKTTKCYHEDNTTLDYVYDGTSATTLTISFSCSNSNAVYVPIIIVDY